MNGKTILIEYTPAPESPYSSQRFEFTRQDEEVLGDALQLAADWLYSTRGFAVITLRNGKKVRLTHEP